MSRYLFVVPPLVGHVNPAVGVAAELRVRGHDVAWAGHPDLVPALAGADAEVYPCAAPPPAERPDGARGPAALKFLWESFLVPLADVMLGGVRDAVDRFRPDVLVVDQQAVAGALVAEGLGLPWATTATTSAELTDPLAALPKVDSWVRGRLADLGRRSGYPPTPADPRFSPYLVLAFTTAELAGEPAGAAGERVRFVGPSIAARPPVDFPWDWLIPGRPTVLVSLGTVNADARFVGECVRAVAARPGLQAVVVAEPGTVDDPPDNVLVRARVPQLELLPRLDAVICHAGHNTVCEALHHGVPLVVAPIRDDQPVVAQQAVDAGVAVRVRFGRADAGHVGAALDTVLTDPSYRDSARRVRKSFRAAGGAHAAADHLVGLAGAG